MSFAASAMVALQDAASGAYAPTRSAGAAFQQAVRAVLQAEDVIPTMQAMVDVVVAVEDLHAAADAAVKQVREALALQMEETGAASIVGTHHSAGLSRKPAFVSIEDEAQIPAEYLVTKQSIDKRLIASAIKDGRTVPGASLMQPNAQTLVLRARKETAQ